MPQPLPAFIDLLAFDAAARNGTFTRAAKDLAVSQPAISRRVAALEADLGVPLFLRDTRPLTLTDAGQRLFEVLRSGLSRLETVVQDIRSRRNEKTLTVTAGPGFSAFWLIPRLPELCAAFPAHDLRIMSGDRAYEAPEGDLHIRFGDSHWPGQEAVKILGEEVYAVCSPVYLQGRSAPLALEALKRERLLQLADPLDRWYTWQSWCIAAGSPTATGLRTLDFDSYSLLIGAALAGQGIALCWSGLLDSHLRSGALVQVSAEAVKSTRGYYATYAQTTAPDAAVARLAHRMAGMNPNPT